MRRGLLRRRTRGLAALILAFMMALAMSGCSAGAVGEASNSWKPPTADQTFYGQTLQWSTCATSVQCAEVKLPVDWSDPQGATIEMSVAKHLATGKKIGTLVMNPGGPGSSAIDYVKNAEYRNYFFGTDLQAHYDIVTFDPRGVGASTPVKCLDGTQMDDFLYNIGPGLPGSAEYVASTRAQFAAFGAACAKNTGALLGHVDTVSVARDLDVLRAVTKSSRLNYLGFSYGTRLGATYAGLFPQNVGRMVLDGAIDPSLTTDQMMVGQVAGFDRAARTYLKACLKTTKTCPFTGSAASAAQQLHDLIAARQADPLTAEDGRKLGVGTTMTAISDALYSESSWSRLSAALKQVQQGDPAGAFALADEYNDRTGAGTFASNSTEAFYATSCLDSAGDPGTVTQLDAKLRSASSIFGTFYADGTTMCQGWPIAPTGHPAKISAKGAAPIMVVGTTGDPATPYAWAQALARQLDSGFLVTNVGEGHTAYSTSANTCIQSTVEGFLLTGKHSSGSIRCR